MKNNVEGFIYMLIYLMSLDTEEERIKFVKIYDTYRNLLNKNPAYKSLLLTDNIYLSKQKSSVPIPQPSPSNLIHQLQPTYRK